MSNPRAVNLSKNILITGSSTGFGRDTAETLARAGHRVFASMRQIDGRNRTSAEALRRLDIAVIELDVTDDGSVERAVATVLDDVGRIDVLVNNAGVASAGVSEAFTVDQVRALFEVNVFGLQRTMRAVLPAMRRRGEGLIINVGSILGRVTFPFFGLYGASKFAVEALTETYRYELSQLGIEVVLVQPSAYPTNMYASIQQPADPARGTAYGEVGTIPVKMFETFMGIFQSRNAPDPHDVAAVIADLVAQRRASTSRRRRQAVWRRRDQPAGPTGAGSGGRGARSRQSGQARARRCRLTPCRAADKMPLNANVAYEPDV